MQKGNIKKLQKQNEELIIRVVHVSTREGAYK